MNGICTTPLTRFPSRKAFSASGESLKSADEHLTRLKTEFLRCIDDLKSKRKEIALLKEQLLARTEDIEQLKADENRNLIELASNREKIDRLESKLKMAESQRHTNVNNSEALPNNRNDLLEQQLERMQEENNELRKKFGRLSKSSDKKDSQSEVDELKQVVLSLQKAKELTESKCIELTKTLNSLRADYEERMNDLDRIEKGLNLISERNLK